jgi:Short-chain dehydrogenases of various substrate specificities
MIILGASSDIARATALAFAKQGWNLHLAGRNMEALQKIATDLSVRTGRTVNCSAFDALDTASHATFWESVSGNAEGLLCAVGLLGEQCEAEHDPERAQAILRTNFTGLVPIFSMAANTFEQRGKGLIIGLGSVAGDRGRASNYVYGSAKAGLEAFLSGLRNRLFTKGVHVMTVKPGFVRTRMTEGLNLPKMLTATPEQVAADIVAGAGKKRGVVYSRWFWRWIMCIITHLPECVFIRLKL